MKRFMNLRTLGKVIGLIALLVFVVALCVGQEAQKPTVAQVSATSATGAELFAQHCALCHGNDLKGSGPFPHPYRVPPDLTTLAKRHGGKFPEAYVGKVLRNGVTLPAHAPAEMPVWSATSKLDKTELETRIKNLTEYIKSRQVQ